MRFRRQPEPPEQPAEGPEATPPPKPKRRRGEALDEAIRNAEPRGGPDDVHPHLFHL